MPQKLLQPASPKTITGRLGINPRVILLGARVMLHDAGKCRTRTVKYKPTLLAGTKIKLGIDLRDEGAVAEWTALKSFKHELRHF